MTHDHVVKLDTYQVVDGLWAGEYPGDPNDSAAQAKVDSLVDAGITCFLDLTEEGEYGLKPYAPYLPDGSGTLTAEHVRVPIPDLGAPSHADMVRILDLIDARMEQGDAVYVHCMGGTGRTGTVIGCYLARHGIATGMDVVAEIAHLRAQTKKAARKSPEMPRQIDMVSTWPEGE